jgi:hypothetical protein
MPENVLEVKRSLAAITHGQRRETPMRTEPGHDSTVAGIGNIEVQAGRILELLPEAKFVKVQDAVQVEYGGEKGIVLIVTAEGLELRLPTVE